MLIEDLQLLLNRRMRTRMYGGVGAAVSNGGGYPITPVMGIGLWGLRSSEPANERRLYSECKEVQNRGHAAKNIHDTQDL